MKKNKLETILDETREGFIKTLEDQKNTTVKNIKDTGAFGIESDRKVIEAVTEADLANRLIAILLKKLGLLLHINLFEKGKEKPS